MRYLAESVAIVPIRPEDSYGGRRVSVRSFRDNVMIQRSRRRIAQPSASRTTCEIASDSRHQFAASSFS